MCRKYEKYDFKNGLSYFERCGGVLCKERHKRKFRVQVRGVNEESSVAASPGEGVGVHRRGA